MYRCCVPDPSVDKLARGIGVLLHVAVGPFYFLSLLSVPLLAWLLLLATWATLLVLIIKVWHVRPRLILSIPLLAILIWFMVFFVGFTFLGWEGA